MQKKLYEFECAAQRENETVREWTIRLERQVTELNVMSKEAAKDNVMGYSEQRDTAVFESTHKFRLLNVHIDNPSHEAFIAQERMGLLGCPGTVCSSLEQYGPRSAARIFQQLEQYVPTY
jgi:hypothetical protein